ncbi:MAG TPA: response regulator [Pseudomonadales bacterium]
MTDALAIVILEDDEALRFVLQRALQRAGHQVTALADSDALLAWLAGPAVADLVLMDLKLQQQTSLGLLGQVRQQLPQACIVMMTAYASIATTVEAIKLGADDYLPKPVSAEEILQRYRQLQGDSGNSSEAATTAAPAATPLSPKRLEWEHIQQVLQQNHGNISETARQLNMHRRTLQRKLQKKPQL